MDRSTKDYPGPSHRIYDSIDPTPPTPPTTVIYRRVAVIIHSGAPGGGQIGARYVRSVYTVHTGELMYTNVYGIVDNVNDLYTTGTFQKTTTAGNKIVSHEYLMQKDLSSS